MLGHPGLSTDSYHSQPSPDESIQPGVLPVHGVVTGDFETVGEYVGYGIDGIGA